MTVKLSTKKYFNIFKFIFDFNFILTFRVNLVAQEKMSSHFNFFRYPAYREPPWSAHKYKKSDVYWKIMVARLAFIVLFQVSNETFCTAKMSFILSLSVWLPNLNNLCYFKLTLTERLQQTPTESFLASETGEYITDVKCNLISPKLIHFHVLAYIDIAYVFV